MLLTKPNRARSSPVVSSVWSFLAGQNYTAILFVVLLIAVIRLPIDYKRMMTITDNDYTVHISYALDILHHRPVPAFIWAHPLWELSLVGIWWLSRCKIDFWQSAIGLQALSSVVTGLMVYFWYGRLPGRPGPWKRAFWAITLAMVAPIALPTLLDGAYYFGYIGLANYHNPTVHVLRPFSILMFILAIEALSRKGHPLWQILVAALTVIAATLLKPNLTITLLPALGLMVVYRAFWIWKLGVQSPAGPENRFRWLLSRTAIDWKLLFFGLAIPAGLLLAFQYVYAYGNGGPESKIVFMPLVVAQTLSGYIALKFFLSVLFPLAVTCVFFKKVWQDDEMILAWLGFAAGAAQYFLLAELPGLAHANFLWGAQISLFVLFAVTARFLLKQNISWKGLAHPKAWFPYLVYLPHIIAGIAYYIFCYVTPHYG